MGFIKCFECGASISENANGCPKCGSFQISGVQCVLCFQLMKASKSVLKYTSHSHIYLHERCGANLYDHRGKCHECGCTLWGEFFSSWESDLMHSFPSIFMPNTPALFQSCRKCGVPNPLKYRGICNICGLPIYEQLHPISNSGINHFRCER